MMAVFGVVTQCSVVEVIEVSRVLAASIIRATCKPCSQGNSECPALLAGTDKPELGDVHV
jgi:hypothetical protein